MGPATFWAGAPSLADLTCGRMQSHPAVYSPELDPETMSPLHSLIACRGVTSGLTKAPPRFADWLRRAAKDVTVLNGQQLTKAYNGTQMVRVPGWRPSDSGVAVSIPVDFARVLRS